MIKASDLTDEMLETAYFGAAANWSKWREDYNHVGHWEERPLLKCKTRFTRFCTEYSLTRTIPGGSEGTEKEKKKMAAARRAVVMEYFRENAPFKAEDLDTYADCVGKECYGEREVDGVKLHKLGRAISPVSLVSKVFCFFDPLNFPPKDTLNSKALGNPKSYEEFRKRFHEEHEKIARALPKGDAFKIPSFVPEEKEDAFKARITDHVLMNFAALGVSWSPGNPLASNLILPHIRPATVTALDTLSPLPGRQPRPATD